MSDIGTKAAAEKWGFTQARVCKWCREGKIEGATQDKKGSPWHIPENAPCPYPKKVKNKE